MGSRPYQPPLGATFTPGGVDDFLMPELISPSPQRSVALPFLKMAIFVVARDHVRSWTQYPKLIFKVRVMPEVPENIQENLAHLELEAEAVKRPRASPPSHAEHPSHGQPVDQDREHGAPRPADPSPPRIRLPSHVDGRGDFNRGPAYADSVPSSFLDRPVFIPLPRLVNPPSTVPPSDEEKEAVLEQKREAVLKSDDAEAQLAWAQEALAHVDVSCQLALRLAEHQLARSRTPEVEHRLRDDAVNIVTFLADQFHPKAEFLRGTWLEFGKFGFRMDKRDAFRCYARAAASGYGRAEYRMGTQFEMSNEPLKATEHILKGVALGDSASHYRFGMMLLLGQLGQRQDYRRGLDHLRFAADTADENAPQGAYVFGMLQARELEHIDVPEPLLPLDPNQARVFIERAAFLGFAKAQVKMGSAYELCQLGCDFSPLLSLHYNALAARQGEADAEMSVSKWFLCGFEGMFEKNEEVAFQFAGRAAFAGLATAEFAMGYFYEVGIYVPTDKNRARDWYEKAARKGNDDAKRRLKDVSESHLLSRRDHDTIALQRIRSQYGSQRGRRPARFQAPVESMPSIPDYPTVMPSPSTRARPADGFLPRAQSVTPYPLEDRPPGSRPTSGLAVRAHIRPATANPALAPSMGLRTPQPRQAVSRGNVRAFNRADSTGSTGHPGPRPLPSHQPSASYSTALRRASGESSLHSQSPSPLQSMGPARLDIGFSAPPDPKADRRHRLHKARVPSAGLPSSPAPAPPREPTDGLLASGRRPHGSPLLTAKEPDHHPIRFGRAPSPAMYGSGPRPPRSRPGSAERAPQLPDAVEPVRTPPPPRTSPGPALHPEAVAPRPPGRGPKTFEEMGVPKASKEDNCAVM
ncbi:MAG: hypothetical protein M1826_002770 [Phylliscum demangeonii]|nr:MAG: hypothetical protein M1826_002770 [Phylliscum demangeonii]